MSWRQRHCGCPIQGLEPHCGWPMRRGVAWTRPAQRRGEEPILLFDCQTVPLCAPRRWVWTAVWSGTAGCTAAGPSGARHWRGEAGRGGAAAIGLRTQKTRRSSRKQNNSIHRPLGARAGLPCPARCRPRLGSARLTGLRGGAAGRGDGRVSIGIIVLAIVFRNETPPYDNTHCVVGTVLVTSVRRTADLSFDASSVGAWRGVVGVATTRTLS